MAKDSHRRPRPGPLGRAGRGLRLLVLFGLGWAAAGEAQTTGRFTSLTHDRALLQKAARFGALELAFPASCAAWPDSVRRTLEAQVRLSLTCPFLQSTIPQKQTFTRSWEDATHA